MNIIFGKEAADSIKEKHTVLELDTITIGGSTPIVVYCVIEHVPLNELAQLEDLKEKHTELMSNYRQRRWDLCEQAINKLTGNWNNEADTFYEDLLNRVRRYKESEPDESWTGIIAKS